MGLVGTGFNPILFRFCVFGGRSGGWRPMYWPHFDPRQFYGSVPSGATVCINCCAACSDGDQIWYDTFLA